MKGDVGGFVAKASPKRSRFLSKWAEKKGSIKLKLLDGKGGPEIMKLVGMLRNNDRDRDLAALMLGEIGYSSRPVLQALRKHARSDPDWVTRANSLEALGALGGKGEVRLLINAMENDGEYICRRMAIMALEKIYRKPGIDEQEIDKILEGRFGKRLRELAKLKDIPRKDAGELVGVHVVEEGRNRKGIMITHHGFYLVAAGREKTVIGRLETEDGGWRLIRGISKKEREMALRALEKGADARISVKKFGPPLEVVIEENRFDGKPVAYEGRIIER